MYDPEYTRTFYNAYGNAEWARLEATAYGRLQAIIHEDFIRRYIKSGDRVLDAGSGPGRFSSVAAKMGARVTVLDISDKQLEIAREKIAAAGQLDAIEKFVRADICDLSMFTDGQFDIIICFGGVLSYVCEKRQKAVNELMRVTRRGGTTLVSVMSLPGATLMITHEPNMPALENIDKSYSEMPSLRWVLETGDVAGYPSRAAKMMHAPMHWFTADELKLLFKECEILETAGSNVMIGESSPAGEKIASSPSAWSTLVELEKKFNHDPGLVNCGSHIIMAVRK